MTTEQRSPMWRILFLVISAIALSALVLAAACGGDDDDDDSDDDASATATRTADGGDDDDDDDEPTDAPDGGDDDDDDDNGDDPFAEIEDLAGEYEGADGVVTYTFTSDEDDGGGTWTIYTQDDSSRVEFGDESGTFISITTPTASYTCTESDDGEGFCYEAEGGVGANPFASFASSEAIFSYLEVFTDVEAENSTENLAGVDAECWTLAGDFETDLGTIKWCFAPNGLLLLAQYDLDSGAFEMRATEFSEDVPSGIFEPPYEVTTLGQ
ncbi:MAG TPA: hypothetical protein VMR52_03400 [Dehalococcoidia bacterium]|nr:hypothetical protein [Dehalococcoidia bacterium]